jgi:hypothetical protein
MEQLRVGVEVLGAEHAHRLPLQHRHAHGVSSDGGLREVDADPEGLAKRGAAGGDGAVDRQRPPFDVRQ